LQRAEVTHIPQVEKLFVEISGSNSTPLNKEQTHEFFSRLIELIAPQYSDSKRETLLQGWKAKTELNYSEVHQQIQKQFIPEFKLKALPLRNYCISGVKTEIPVLVQIETPFAISQEKAKPPIAISCVLDRSGSMSGSKLKFAIRAVCKVIKHLGPKDIFHLVTYDHKIGVPIRNGDLSDKESLKAIVRGISCGGSTNIGDALVRASSLLDTTELPPNCIKRIYLFSDGAANAGEITSSEGLSNLAKRINQETNISLSSFGLGKDYNEETMKGIAKNGAGEYYFIASAEDIPVTMSKAIHGLLDLYGTNAHLLLRGKGNGIVSKLFGKFADCDVAKPILLGDLYANDRKAILVALEVACNSETDDKQVICSCSLSFDKVDHSTTPQPINETVVCEVSLTFTRDENTVNNSQQNNAVSIAQVMQETASIDRKIVSLLDKRDYDASIALKQKSLEMLKEAQQFDDELSLPKVIGRVEEVLKFLKEKKDHSAVRKLVDWEACREEEGGDHGYYCLSDSDDGCYSDENIDLDLDDLNCFSSDDDSF